MSEEAKPRGRCIACRRSFAESPEAEERQAQPDETCAPEARQAQKRERDASPIPRRSTLSGRDAGTGRIARDGMKPTAAHDRPSSLEAEVQDARALATARPSVINDGGIAAVDEW